MTAGVVLANMFYLQEILSVYSPVSVAWSLCAELQFYLFFILLLWAFQWLRQRRAFAAGTDRRVWTAGDRVHAFGRWLRDAGPWHCPDELRGIYLDHWHLFFLGTVAYWSLMGVISSIWFWVYIVFMLLLCKGSILGGVGCGLAILAIARLGLLDSKTRGRFLPYIGSRSYSIYLTHVLVGSNLARLLLRANWVPETFLVLTGFFVLSLAASHSRGGDPLSVGRVAHALPRPQNRLGKSFGESRHCRTPAPAIPQFGCAGGGGMFASSSGDGGRRLWRQSVPRAAG